MTVIDVLLVCYWLALMAYLFWGPIFGASGAYKIWKYRDTLKIRTTEHVSLRSLIKALEQPNNNINLDNHITYTMHVTLPKGSVIEWIVSKDGIPGFNGDITDKVQPTFVYLYQPVFVDNIDNEDVESLTYSRRRHAWRMSWLTKRIIRSISDEKLVLHKLSE